MEISDKLLHTSIPHFKFPEVWYVTFTPNHWSIEERIARQEIIVPYVRSERQEHMMSEDYPTLAIFDVFKGQKTKYDVRE